VITTSKKIENFIEDNDEWYSDLELKVLDLEKELTEWRESRTRDSGHGSEVYGSPPRREREMLRARGNAQHVPRGSAGRARGSAGQARGSAERAQVLIERGRRTARRRGAGRGHIAIGSAAVLVVLVIGAMVVLRKGPSWPPSVATVKTEITTACENPNVVSEPSQVNFACDTGTSQILWVFALMTSNNDPVYADAKTGRKGLEPITPAQGGQIAWSLNLHHPYNPFSPVDSLEVAARAINNIIGGATLTGANGKPAVQPGLESKPENCARYTGSPAVISRAGFPSRCASPVISREGQAALVADVYQQWMPGASPVATREGQAALVADVYQRWMPGAGSVAAQNVSVLFQNADHPGDPQVQAILKGLPDHGG
jgi:hypothetical protein